MPRAAASLAVLMLLEVVTTAHHSVLGFDSSRAIRLQGIVCEVSWSNPHAYIAMVVRAGAHRGERWTIESESPVVLRRLGWTQNSVRAGQAIETTGAPDRQGRQIMRCQSVSVEGQSPLPCYPAHTQ